MSGADPAGGAGDDAPESLARWEFWIDRGGTFTDCIGRGPTGVLHTAKVLSSDDAPVEGIRRILAEHAGLAADAPLPPCDVKLGSTVATNALLERRGVRTLWVTNCGFADLLEIGTQQRPELFELAIEKVEPLPERMAEVDGRTGADGSEIGVPDWEALREKLSQARADGIEAVAISLIHSYLDASLEERAADLAREEGFSYVIASHAVARELGMLARSETTVADAYLTPLLQRHTQRLAHALPGSRLRFMQSSGGLTEAARFHGPNALLSGPAGGVVAAARVAERAGVRGAVGFDMGGTSTDVSLIVDGAVDRAYETTVAGIRVKAPMLRIHTVAAGGGSLCRFDGFRLSVGPESAGADPGPLCYGRGDGSGGLALTDINLALGRVQPDRFPFELDHSAVRGALDALASELQEAGLPMSPDEIAAGFIAIANANMAQAIAQVSVARGVDPRDFALVGFGGAGGQHVCAVARELGIRKVLLHPLAGLLSAYGIGVADLTWDGQRDAGRVPLADAELALPAELREAFAALEAQGRATLREEGARGDAAVQRLLDLRYRGSDTFLTLFEPEAAADSRAWRQAFSREHRRRFGYEREDREVEIGACRVAVRSAMEEVGEQEVAEDAWNAQPRADSSPADALLRRARAWFPGVGWQSAPVYAREGLRAGAELRGPALLLEDTGSVVIDPGFRARLDAGGVLHLEDEAGSARPAADDLERADPVRLEVVGNRFMSVAEQMGAVLRNTAFSTNIKDRLDYSCAVFDRDGGLVANAPHIPVHLGAMSETVRALRRAFPELKPGEVLVTNDPFAGGSHLPDVTVVTPVFQRGSTAPAFFVASRGHHADLGGKTPGSMPADSRTLAEEGVLIPPMRAVRDGRLEEAALRRVLAAGRYPARRPDDNLADLEAMIAANRGGEELLLEWVEERGLDTLQVTTQQLQAASAAKVRREIGRLPDGEHRFEDALDDGTRVVVCVRIAGEEMQVDFAGTGAAVPGNLNAPPAVVHAAVLYVLRCLVADRIPLNSGCLEPVTILIPEGSLLSPPPGSAVVGGNVETSQRVVDVLLGALGLAAASQGTMNNVTFGDADFGYYETIGGGAGAGPGFSGAHAVHTHMTNTRITDPEVLEARFPVRLVAFERRRGSGGRGRFVGGDGLVRCYEFLRPVTVSLLTERRDRSPFGLAGGGEGARGRNEWIERDGTHHELPGHRSLELRAGDRLRIETPGGGGFGDL